MVLNNKLSLDEEFKELLEEGVHDKGIFKAVFLAGGPGSGKDYVLKHTLDGHGLTEIHADKAFDYLHDKEKLKTDPSKVKSTKELRQLLAVHGRNGLIVNGTHDDHHRVKKIKKGLENLGYDTKMLMVHTDDETSRKRNVERGQRGGRTVPEKMRREKWEGVQEARRHHAANFGDHYHEFDNSDDLRTATPDLIKQKKEELAELHDHIHNFVTTPPESEKSQKWINKAVETNDTPIPRKGAEKMPHPGSQAYQQSQEEGLSYFGSGRYGKNGKVTHHTINDNLVSLEDHEKAKEKLKPKVKKLNEDINVEFDNIFKIGTQDASMVKEFIQEEGREGRETFTTETKESYLCKEESTKPRPKSLMEFRKSFGESIDQGIESGLSMATSGENLARNSMEKPKKNGKPDTGKITELTGDETTASISNQKEDELTKKGISFSKFKSKQVI
jgi:hypothetical protein